MLTKDEALLLAKHIRDTSQDDRKDWSYTATSLSGVH